MAREDFASGLMIGGLTIFSISFLGYDHITDRLSQIEEYMVNSSKGFEKYFPAYISIKTDSIDVKELSILRKSLERDNSVISEKNLCKILLVETDLEDKRHLVSSGNCIYVTPHLALTAYHVIHENDADLHAYSTRIVNSNNEDTWGFPVAISPRYDLALLYSGEAFTSIDQISVKPWSRDNPNLELKSCGVKTPECLMEKRPLLQNGMHENFFYFNEAGTLMFPSLIVDQAVVAGMSGSPVFQDNNLIGLVVQSSEVSSAVSQHVYDFLAQFYSDQREEK